MIRLVRGVIHFATGTAFAQAPPPATDYFPLHPKAKWVYRIGDQDVVAECAGLKLLGNQEAFELVISIGGKQTASDWYVIKKDGVYRVRSKNDPAHRGSPSREK